MGLTMSGSFDAAVIGAGVAGAALAATLARAGHRVLLLERQRFPRTKVCGGCLHREGLAVLNRLGLGGCVPADAPAVEAATVWSGGRATRVPSRHRARGGAVRVRRGTGGGGGERGGDVPRRHDGTGDAGARRRLAGRGGRRRLRGRGGGGGRRARRVVPAAGSTASGSSGPRRRGSGSARRQIQVRPRTCRPAASRCSCRLTATSGSPGWGPRPTHPSTWRRRPIPVSCGRAAARARPRPSWPGPRAYPRRSRRLGRGSRRLAGDAAAHVPAGAAGGARLPRRRRRRRLP